MPAWRFVRPSAARVAGPDRSRAARRGGANQEPWGAARHPPRLIVFSGSRTHLEVPSPRLVFSPKEGVHVKNDVLALATCWNSSLSDRPSIRVEVAQQVITNRGVGGRNLFRCAQGTIPCALTLERRFPVLALAFRPSKVLALPEVNRAGPPIHNHTPVPRAIPVISARNPYDSRNDPYAYKYTGMEARTEAMQFALHSVE